MHQNSAIVFADLRRQKFGLFRFYLRRNFASVYQALTHITLARIAEENAAELYPCFALMG